MPRTKRDGSSPTESHMDDGEEDDNLYQCELVHLGNFDEENHAQPILTSPRSIEACRMLGVEPYDLVKRSLDYFIAHSNPTDEPSLIAKRASRFEKTRLVQLQRARAQRQELIDAELHGLNGGMSLQTRSFCRSPLAGKLSSGKHNESIIQSSQRDFTVIEREKRELERIRQRQAQEMQQLLSFELKMAELHRERELKEQEQFRQEERSRRMKLRRQREADEQKRKRELEKAEQQRLEIERTRQEMLERQQEILRKAELEEREKERRRRETQLSEKERIRKQEEQRIQNELYQLQLQQEAERKALEIEKRDEKRRMLLEHKRRQKAQEVSEKQQKNKMRITSVLQDREYMRQLQVEDAERKHQESEERRRIFELERRIKEEEIRLQAQKKKEMIESVQQQLHQIEHLRRQKLIEQEASVEKRLKLQDLEKRRVRDEQRREEQRQEQERRRVYQRMEEQLKLKQTTTLSKSEQKTAIAKMVQAQKRHLIRSRLQEAKLREEEIQAALLRRQKQDNYRVNVLLSRIESDNERARIIKEQREQLIRRRQQIKSMASRQKQELMDSFYKMKVTKKYDLPKNLQESLISRPQSASVLQTRSLIQEAQECDHGYGQPRKQKRPASAAARSTRVTDLHTSSRPATSRSAEPGMSDDDLGVGIDDSDDDKAGRSDIEAFASEIDELRRQQNEELLHVLQQEHHAEEQREYLLQQVKDETERSRMLSIFGKERAHASERIMMLTQQHEEALAVRMRAL